MDNVAPPATCPCGGSSHEICRRNTARASTTSSVHIISHLFALETPSRVALARRPLSRETLETHLRRRDRRLHPQRARPAPARRDDRENGHHHHHHHRARARASRRPRARHRGVATSISHREAPRGPTTSRRRHSSSRARRRGAASDARRLASSSPPSRASSSVARSREASRCRVERRRGRRPSNGLVRRRGFSFNSTSRRGECGDETHLGGRLRRF